MKHNKDVEHQDVKMYCSTNHFPRFQFFGPHNKPHFVRGLVEHYRMCFYPKIGHGTCAIRRIPFYCTLCTSIIEQPWVTGIPSQQQHS